MAVLRERQKKQQDACAAYESAREAHSTRDINQDIRYLYLDAGGG